jgi:hypothetical protein
MGSEVKCDDGHAYPGPRRKAAREIFERGALKPCSHCGKNMHYFVSHTYPYHRVTVRYEVLRVLAMFPIDRAESEGYDPMMFIMKNLANGKKTVWLYYWTKNRHGKWANGQFPPLLSIEDFKRAIKELDEISEDGHQENTA